MQAHQPPIPIRPRTRLTATDLLSEPNGNVAVTTLSLTGCRCPVVCQCTAPRILPRACPPLSSADEYHLHMICSFKRSCNVPKQTTFVEHVVPRMPDMTRAQVTPHGTTVYLQTQACSVSTSTTNQTADTYYAPQLSLHCTST